jgi:hypothetical protein
MPREEHTMKIGFEFLMAVSMSIAFWDIMLCRLIEIIATFQRVVTDGVTTEAEESPLLRFITRKRLVKTLQKNGHY